MGIQRHQRGENHILLHIGLSIIPEYQSSCQYNLGGAILFLLRVPLVRLAESCSPTAQTPRAPTSLSQRLPVEQKYDHGKNRRPRLH